MKLATLALIGAALFGQTALAVDYDYEAARRAWEAKQDVADSATSEYQAEKSRLDALQATVDRETNNVNTLQNQVESLRTRISDKRTQVQQKQTQREQAVQDREDLKADLQTKQDTLSDVQRDRDNTAEQLRTLRQSERELVNLIRVLEGQPGDGPWTCVYVDHGTEEHRGGHRATNADRATADADAKAACLAVHGSCDLNRCSQPDSPALRQARLQLEDVRRDIQTTESRLSDLDNRIARLKSDIQDLREDIQAKNTLITRLATEIQTLNADIQDLSADLDLARQRLNAATVALDDARRARDRQTPVVNAARTEMNAAVTAANNAKTYYNQVLANYNNARSAAADHGRAQAANDAGREASERATPVAATDGDQDGTAKGRTEGTAAAREVAGVQGYNRGLARGDADAALADAFNSGIASGKALAHAKADAEDRPASYNSTLSGLLASTPDETLEVDITSSLPDVPGDVGPLQSTAPKAIGRIDAPAFLPKADVPVRIPTAGSVQSNAPRADHRYDRAQCDGEPLLEFVTVCRNAYASEYDPSFARSYDSVYRTQYTEAFGVSARIAYNAARQTTFPDVELAQAKVGAKDLGTLRGFAAELQTAKTQAVAAGQADVQRVKASGYLPVLRSVSLVDDVRDGVLAPGEAVRLKVVIDNLGDLNGAKEDLLVRLTGIDNAAFDVTLRKLPALKAKARIVLTGVLPGRLAREAGKTAHVRAQLSRSLSPDTALDVADFEGVIKSPVEISAVSLPSGLRVGTAVDATLSLTNNTQVDVPAGAAAFRLVGEGLTSTVTSVDLPALAAGATATVAVRVTPTAAASDTIPVDFQLTLANVGGANTLTISKGVVVPVTRAATLRVCLPTCGAVLRLPLQVTAGQAFSIPTELKVTAQGTYNWGKTAASNPGIGTVSDTTVRVGPFSTGPTTMRDNWQYTVSTSLRGTLQWIMLDVKVGATQIQTLKLPIQVN